MHPSVSLQPTSVVGKPLALVCVLERMQGAHQASLKWSWRAVTADRAPWSNETNYKNQSTTDTFELL